MKVNDVHIRITKRSSSNIYYPLFIETKSGGRHRTRYTISSNNVSSFDFFSGWDLGVYLYEGLTNAGLWHFIEDVVAINNSGNSRGAFLIEITAPELFHLPWEKLFDSPQLNTLSQVFLIHRFVDKPSQVVIKPIQFPLDVLIFSDLNSELVDQLPDNDSLQYYHNTKSVGGLTEQLFNLISSVKFDIVHLIACAEFRNSSTSVLFPANNKTEIKPKDLLLSLRRCGARFLILQCIDDQYGALLNFAHYLLHPNGPSILVLDSNNQTISGSSKHIMNNIYLDIVHDTTLDYIFQNISSEFRPALFIASGGTDILRISPQGTRLYSQLENQRSKLLHIHDILTLKAERIDPDPDLPQAKLLSKNLRFIEQEIEYLSKEIIPEEMLNYAFESGGMMPLTKAEQKSNALEKRLRELSANASRVVNSWFRKDDYVVPQKKNLNPVTKYQFEVQIGVASSISNVQNAISIPEDELARFYSKDGIELEVELFSTDFEIERSSKSLTLPRPPEESKTVTFNIITPENDCIAKLRVCFYYKQNLIQSLVVRAVIGIPKTKLVGNLAVVDYSLSGNLTNIENLQSRKLNIAINKNHNGTHSFYIKGKELKRQFDFGEGELKNTIKKAREKLQVICGTKSSGYKYNKNNQGSEKKFLKDLTSLAYLGYKLYSKIVLGEDWAFEDKLNQALKNSEASIQIASTKSAKFVFPWALVYDKPLLQGDNEICQYFLSDLKNGNSPDFLNKQTCITNGCPNHDQANIICPSGFWGFKHTIEQPLSQEENIFGTEFFPPNIVVRGGGKINFMMGISQELLDAAVHKSEIDSLGNLNLDFLDTKQSIGLGLQRKDLHLIYFYCHGGRKGSEVWLGLGKKNELIIPSDLIAWRVRWPQEHPLVFINGCHTTDVTPDDFVSLNNILARSQAAGIIGTEITIPEILARHFATGFYDHFLNGNNLGVSIRRQRLAMLQNYNLLGLAYTPYCSAELKIIHKP